MSKHMLFAGFNNQPEGGFHDFRMSGTFDECKAYFAELQGAYEWGEIVNHETLEEVEYFCSAHNEWRKS